MLVNEEDLIHARIRKARSSVVWQLLDRLNRRWLVSTEQSPALFYLVGGTEKGRCMHYSEFRELFV